MAGVCLALLWANLHPDRYRAFIGAPVIGNVSLLFVTNDPFMLLFFGIAAAEITRSCLPGGDLHPPKRAVNPL